MGKIKTNPFCFLFVLSQSAPSSAKKGSYKKLIIVSINHYRREEIMKPTNPAAQKAALLNSNSQYKVSPHRGLKAKVKPLSGGSGAISGANKSTIFDGLEEDDDDVKNDVFVPRSSVKKLVLKPKSPMANHNLNSHDDSTNNLNESNCNNVEDSLNLPTVKKLPPKPTMIIDVHDESFSNLNTKRKDILIEQQESILENAECDLDFEQQPGGIKLRRAGYYTIPSMSELATMVDTDGNLNVENFTIGRSGYGNIFFPGVTNIRGMNFDDIVFFRHKEVIVYPMDDSSKPDLGQGLNKKSQVTLDKVWPVDKSNQMSVKSPDKLASLNYEEKLQKACNKLGARFVEYRPETGSWVFKVDHFSKYGLDDSDEENDPKMAVKKPTTTSSSVLFSPFNLLSPRNIFP
jgi:nuclear pore complex protein Nup98-Nup96